MLSYLLAAFCAWLFLFAVGPAIVVALMPMPSHVKRGAVLSVFDAALRELVRLPFSLTAPIAVPILIAAGKLRWGYERVGNKDGWLDALWGNNVRFLRSDGVFVGGVNGDKFVWQPNAQGVGEPMRFPLSQDKASEDYATGVRLNYWCKGEHGRSKLSRWVWLGLRNRAARLASLLSPRVPGLRANGFDETHGDTLTNLDRPGWFAARFGGKWQVHACLPVPGTRYLWRFNGGFKLRNALQYEGHEAHASNLLFSLRKSEVQ